MGPGKRRMVFLLVLVVSLSLVSAQSESHITEDQLVVLNTPTKGLLLQHSFRCGMFIINPKNDNGRPVISLKIFNATFDAREECEAKKANVKRYNDFCQYLLTKAKAPFVGRRSRKFPNGVEFGLFSNSCNDSAWHYTGWKHQDRVCC